MFTIKTENFYEDFYRYKKLFDFSNNPKDSKYYNNSKNLVLGKMKVEACSLLIKGFSGLKHKIYTFITEDNHKSKCINKKCC